MSPQHSLPFGLVRRLLSHENKMVNTRFYMLEGNYKPAANYIIMNQLLVI